VKDIVPKHLSRETRKWFRKVTETYVLEEHHLKLLTLAAEAWERSRQAESILQAEGLTILDRHGIQRSHPLVKVKQESEVVFARLIRELALDVEPPNETRMPRLH
jgi:P27 family predicted phage terminase small subunit